MSSVPEGLTSHVARLIADARWRDLPEEVRNHAVRSLVNVVGCAAGGLQHEAVEIAGRALHASDASGDSPVIGRRMRTTPRLAALLNGLSASVYAFDDTHAATMVHPGSPVGAALVAATGAAGRAVAGSEFALAFALGIEIACRLGRCIARPDALSGWSGSGLAGAVGAAAACSRLLQSGHGEVASAIGIAASLASGLRVAHGTMTMHLVPAHAAALGVEAAILAHAGFTGPKDALEGRHGFLSAHGAGSDGEVLTAEWGSTFELLGNTFKAYPCGIVIHPVIDACLRLRSEHGLESEEIVWVDLTLSPAAGQLTNRGCPRTIFEAQVSAQHWAAVVLVDGQAGLAQLSRKALEDAAIGALRSRCRIIVADMTQDAAEVRVTRSDGRVCSCRIDHYRGSSRSPLSDAEITHKFLAQAEPALGSDRAAALLQDAWSLERLDDVRPVWDR